MNTWTRERVERLDTQDILNLQANAARLGEAELESLCAELLAGRPRGGTGGGATRPRLQKTLVPRNRAFEARGIWLDDPRTSWSGVRKADGGVVIAMWQDAVRSQSGACFCLLWAPNVGGKRPWSESAAGRERLAHCKLAIARESAEGLLVHGEALEGRLPEDRARTILGIDPETVIRFRVEMRGAEYWASWGRKTA